MVTIIKKLTGGAYPFYEYACLSTDIKPVSLVPENSICHEIDTGKHFYFGNGEWQELPPKGGSGGGSGGEGLPADFPAEGRANANKFLGFDSSGDYAALDAPSGGGAEKFVVTLTQENDTWTADKTISEIAAADAANKVVVCKIVIDGTVLPTYEVPLSAVADYVAVFGGVSMQGGTKAFVAYGLLGGGVTQWVVDTVELGSSNEPMIVTLTLENDGEHDNWIANKTCAQIYAAHQAGKECVVQLTYAYEGFDIPVEAPLAIAIGMEDDGETAYACTFSIPFVFETNTIAMLNIAGFGSNKEEWDVWLATAAKPIPYGSINNGQVLGVSSGNLAWVDNYAPLIVTMTEDQQNPGTYVGDKTIGEIKTAFEAGRNVVGTIPALNASVSVSQIAIDDSNIVISTGNKDITFMGAANEYPSITP